MNCVDSPVWYTATSILMMPPCPTPLRCIRLRQYLKNLNPKQDLGSILDYEDEDTGKGRRIDPLILDLNRDGKFDITGANQEGNGKIDGDTVQLTLIHLVNLGS